VHGKTVFPVVDGNVVARHPSLEPIDTFFCLFKQKMRRRWPMIVSIP